MPASVIYVLAKQPREGRVKTRLCPPLTQARACRLAEAFATDTLEGLAAARQAARFDLRLALDDDGEGFLAGESSSAAGFDLRSLARGLGMEIEGQGDGDLGLRMARLVERGTEGGAPTILVGTDSPDMPVQILIDASRALASVDVVMAPAADGGYVLVGARRPVRELFEIDAPWSGRQVFEATCKSLRRARCPFETLPAWEDVDDAASLRRLAARLQQGRGRSAPATTRLLAEWTKEGVRF